MKKIAHLSFACFFVFSAYSQQNLEIGYFLSNTGEPIDNMLALDPPNGEIIDISINNLEEYVYGYYIDNSGNKIEGYIKRKQSRPGEFNYKKLTTDDPKKITVNEAKIFKVGLDSFVVVPKVNSLNTNTSYSMNHDSWYLSVDVYGDSLILYQDMSSSLTKYYFQYKNKIYSLPNSHKVVNKFLLKLFDDIEPLREYIKEHYINQTSISKFFDTYENYYKYINSDTVFLNNQYIKCTKHGASFYMIIDDFNGSNFDVSYYSDTGTKLLSGSYKSINPQERHGDFLWYYPNGKIRKKATYEDNEITSSEVYFKSGQIHYKIGYTEYSDDSWYEKIYNYAGDEIINRKTKNGYESFYDSIRSRTIQRQYFKGKLKESIVFGDKTFSQITKRNLRYPSLTVNIWAYFKSNLKYDDRMVRAEEQGTAYVRVLVDSNGKLDEIEVIQGLSVETDKKILEAFTKTDEKFMIWKAAKRFEDTPISQEVIIPINFKILSQKKKNNYYYYDPFMFQQMHQMQMNNIPVPQGF
ncbi:hypothetical protein [Reichenbachiella sp.]|uniref:hypothetical protein n=1 Tax=Reichenbachiella sp. TaxID=2184521 RepID=UPI003B59795E